MKQMRQPRNHQSRKKLTTPRGESAKGEIGGIRIGKLAVNIIGMLPYRCHFASTQDDNLPSDRRH